MTVSQWVLVGAGAIVMVGFLLSMTIFKRDKKTVSKPLSRIYPNSIPSDGVQVPVLRTYTGLKRLAPVTFVENKFQPRLVLFKDHFEFRVLRRRSLRYDRIEAIYSYSSRTYNKLQINFTRSSLFFMAVFGNQETLSTVVDFLGKKGIYPQSETRP